jgi:predicted O-linked N-acetylglucosamine transferase (SPINDLY family)
VAWNHPLLEEAWRLHRGGDHEKAALLYRSVLREQPRNYDALYLIGFLYGQQRQFDEAQYFIGEAIKANPFSADAFFLRGFTLQQLDRPQEALACFGEALKLNPHHSGALLDRASCLFRLRRYEEAALDYERLLARDPDSPYARGNLLFSRLHSCDWRDFEAQRSEIRARLAAGARVIAPFDAKALSFTPEEELRAARIWVADQCPAKPFLWRGERYGHERIRLAYVSADFHAHAAATLLAGLFEHHDRSRFETIGVSFGPDDGSSMRARLRGAFDRFIEVRAKSDDEIAALMREMEVDIAVDLMGFTEGCRPGIFAARPAPLQVNYLGYPGTMGADHMDYLIADEIVAPQDQRACYAEKIVSLPDTFMPADSRRQLGTRLFTRDEEGLPEKGYVFCCFNASYKITPPIFAIWMRLLSTAEASVLWLGQQSAAARRNLLREAEARGIGRERLVFAGRRDLAADHLARHALADLFLDTLPYNAHATASDALWAGVPVLTCIGEGFAGRVAASLLHAIGLPELIAESLEAYEQAALNLAQDANALAAVRAKLQRNRDTHPLFDTARYTRNLESAYIRMWERHMRGEPPQSFAVKQNAAEAATW